MAPATPAKNAPAKPAAPATPAAPSPRPKPVAPKAEYKGPTALHIFAEADKDDSGTLTLDELNVALQMEGVSEVGNRIVCHAFQACSSHPVCCVNAVGDARRMCRLTAPYGSRCAIRVNVHLSMHIRMSIHMRAQADCAILFKICDKNDDKPVTMMEFSKSWKRWREGFRHMAVRMSSVCMAVHMPNARDRARVCTVQPMMAFSHC